MHTVHERYEVLLLGFSINLTTKEFFGVTVLFLDNIFVNFVIIDPIAFSELGTFVKTTCNRILKVEIFKDPVITKYQTCEI